METVKGFIEENADIDFFSEKDLNEGFKKKDKIKYDVNRRTFTGKERTKQKKIRIKKGLIDARRQMWNKITDYPLIGDTAIWLDSIYEKSLKNETLGSLRTKITQWNMNVKALKKLLMRLGTKGAAIIKIKSPQEINKYKALELKGFSQGLTPQEQMELKELEIKMADDIPDSEVKNVVKQALEINDDLRKMRPIVEGNYNRLKHAYASAELKKAIKENNDKAIAKFKTMANSAKNTLISMGMAIEGFVRGLLKKPASHSAKRIEHNDKKYGSDFQMKSEHISWKERVLTNL